MQLVKDYQGNFGMNNDFGDGLCYQPLTAGETAWLIVAIATVHYPEVIGISENEMGVLFRDEFAACVDEYPDVSLHELCLDMKKQYKKIIDSDSGRYFYFNVARAVCDLMDSAIISLNLTLDEDDLIFAVKAMELSVEQVDGLIKELFDSFMKVVY